MNPIHKAILIAKTIYENKSGDNYSDCVESAIKMHEWDRQQFIEWAVEWINDNYMKYQQPINDYERIKNSNVKNSFVNNFKKDAEEQLEIAKGFDYKEEQISHDIRTTTYEIFPELKESEDEKIKRCISDIVRNYGMEFATGTVTKEKMLAWLEKQAEPKLHWKPTQAQLEFLFTMSCNSGLYLEERDFLEELYNKLKEF